MSNNGVDKKREQYEYAALQFIQRIIEKRPDIDDINLAGHTQPGQHIHDIILTRKDQTSETIEVKGSVLIDQSRRSMNRVKLYLKDFDDLPNWFLFVFDTSQFGLGETDFRYLLLPGPTVEKFLPKYPSSDIVQLPYHRIIQAYNNWEKPKWLEVF